MLLEKYYKEGYDEVGVVPTNDEAVAGVDEGLNSSQGRVWSDNGSLSLASCFDLVSWHQLCCMSQELSQLEERDIVGRDSILVVVRHENSRRHRRHACGTIRAILRNHLDI